MGKIVTEQEAYNIGDSKGTPIPNKGCTKARAEALGCAVSGVYTSNKLVQATNLFVVRKVPILINMRIEAANEHFFKDGAYATGTIKMSGDGEFFSTYNFTPKERWVKNSPKYIDNGAGPLPILGLIDREVHDIDIFTYEINDFLRSKTYKNKYNHLYEFEQRCFRYESILYDIFTVQKGKLRYIDVDFEGIKLKVCDPLETYNMKLLSNKRKWQIPDFEALKTFKPTGRLKTLFRK